MFNVFYYEKLKILESKAFRPKILLTFFQINNFNIQFFNGKSQAKFDDNLVCDFSEKNTFRNYSTFLINASGSGIMLRIAL